MKNKILFLLVSIFLTVNLSFASSSPKYDLELNKIKSVKKAQISVIKTNMNEIAAKMLDISLNKTMSESEKKSLTIEYQKQLDELAVKKYEIEQKYKSDKQILKDKYK